MEFILQDEDNVRPFIDNVITLGPTSYYLDEHGVPEVLTDNPGIHRFGWEYLVDVHRVLHRFAFVGVKISGPKLYIAVPDALVVGIQCNINGHSQDLANVQKILTWPACVSVS